MPDPDSPTKASVFPFLIEKDIEFTAVIEDSFEENFTDKLLTSRIFFVWLSIYKNYLIIKTKGYFFSLPTDSWQFITSKLFGKSSLIIIICLPLG